MRTKIVLDYFSNENRRMARRRAADALGISLQAVCQWGRWVPERQAVRLRELTAGKLQIDKQAPYGRFYDQV